MQKPTAQQIAQNIAKQTLHESQEFVKSASEQIMPFPGQNNEQKEKPPENKPEEPLVKNLSFLNEYKSELNQIRRDALFKELQQKISEGDEVPLENYSNELGYEEREVLRAQIEAIKIRKAQESIQIQSGGIREIVSKKGRQMFNKIKKRNEQHVETRMPPSS